jgi:hypothetical protein
MSTTSFTDAMDHLSETLYARALEHRGEARNIHAPGQPGVRENARTQLRFEVKIEEGGGANLEVNKYCAGYLLSCEAEIESPHPGTVLSGHVESSEGGGLVFGNFHPGKRLRFDLATNFWGGTKFTLHLRSAPALPAGTVLTVRMDIAY